MKLFLLPGSDLANKDWAERIRPILGQHADTVQIQNYKHWNTGGSMNVNQEVASFIETLESYQGPFGVFAKSAGILVALEALAESHEPPSYAIFAGFPLGMAALQDLEVVDLLDTIDFPVLFIQNAYDPTGSAEELRRLTTRIETAEFLLLPGNSHDYPLVGNTLAAVEEFMMDAE